MLPFVVAIHETVLRLYGSNTKSVNASELKVMLFVMFFHDGLLAKKLVVLATISFDPDGACAISAAIFPAGPPGLGSPGVGGVISGGKSTEDPPCPSTTDSAVMSISGNAEIGLYETLISYGTRLWLFQFRPRIFVAPVGESDIVMRLCGTGSRRRFPERGMLTLLYGLFLLALRFPAHVIAVSVSGAVALRDISCLPPKCPAR